MCKNVVLVLLVAVLSACAPAIPATSDPFCAGAIPRAADAHSVALVGDGVPDAVVVTGAALIEALDAGCDR